MKKTAFHILFLSLLTFNALGVYGQITVTGIITSQEGEQLPGVSIAIKGTRLEPHPT